MSKTCQLCDIKGHTKRNKKFHPVKEDSANAIKSIHPKVMNTTLDTDTICQFIATLDNPKIELLRQKEVIQWLNGDVSFLPGIEQKNKSADQTKLKVLEDTWGRAMLKSRRPDLKLDKQWTNKFGEHICEELYMVLGSTVTKPEKKEHYQPDLQTEHVIIEAKAGTFHTGGTAGEKILGCPFKYADIPSLYGKPLKIVCMGGAELVCREQYGNLQGVKTTVQKNKFLDFFRQHHIEYIGATDLLLSFSKMC
jgi:hypothetical protein